MLWNSVHLLTKCIHVYRAGSWMLSISRYHVYLCLRLLQFNDMLMNHILWPLITTKDDLQVEKSKVFLKFPGKGRSRSNHNFQLLWRLGRVTWSCSGQQGLACCGSFLTGTTSYTSYALAGLRAENKHIFSSFTSHAQQKASSPSVFPCSLLSPWQLWYHTMFFPPQLTCGWIQQSL